MRRLLRLSIFASVVISVSLFGVSALIYPMMAGVDRCAPSDISPANFTIPERDARPYQMPNYESVQFRSRDGKVLLSGWYVQASTPDAPAVIVVHGVSACKRGWASLLPAGMLHRAGFATLIIDLRNHGDSQADNGYQAMGTKEYLDVLGAWDWLVQVKRLRPAQIGLFGYSLGAATMIDAGGMEAQIAAVWADSPFYSADLEVDHAIQGMGAFRLFKPFSLLAARLFFGDAPTNGDLQPGSLLSRYGNRPLFITHGSKDELIPPENLTRFSETAQRAGVKLETWLVPGSGHVAAMYDQTAEYERRLTGFFEKTLK